jgi:hypothetical protein
MDNVTVQNLAIGYCAMVALGLLVALIALLLQRR